MKRILLVVTLGVFTTFSFAQKKAIKEAKSEIKKNTNEARALIKPALTNPETMNDPEAWKIAGDIEYEAFSKERDAQMTQEITKKAADEEKMYTGLFNMYIPYLKADSLGELPDEKGKIKNKYRKDIIKTLKETHMYLINGGAYYHDKKDYARAADFFERYWEMPRNEIFKHDNDGGLVYQDTVYQTMKYYAVITAIQSGNQPRAIKFLNNIINEGYIPNSAYKESDPYELLASEYAQMGDSAKFMEILKVGAKKFPSNQYFTPNLINEFIKSGKKNEAIDYIDQAIANDPSNACNLYSVKGSLYADSEQKDYEKAEAAYQQALTLDLNCEKALEGIGVIYILQAQDIKDQAGQATNRKVQAELDSQTANLYSKSLPSLEKCYELMKARNAEPEDMRLILIKLQNVYYNLSLLNIDKSKEVETISAELEAVNKELGIGLDQ